MCKRLILWKSLFEITYPAAAYYPNFDAKCLLLVGSLVIYD